MLFHKTRLLLERHGITCRHREKISQAPAPFRVIARGWAGPGLAAMTLFEMFGRHQPA
jgi:transposase